MALTIGIPPTALRALYQPVGQLVVTWGIIDVTTASIVAIIFSRAGGKHKEKEVPRQIGRKVTFLRRCFRQIDALAAVRDEAIALCDEIDRLKEFREVVAHAHPDSYDIETGIYRFTKLETNKDHGARTHTPMHAELNIEALTDAARDSITLIRNSVAFNERLIEAWVPENERNNRLGRI